ncbi:unnamed protein product [Toxocara canis]|uniref:G protein-coupled receptor n=1 Tax=Toxocara canis TaxID=6265 RepID=A0A183UN65_TOXCA|nr:unnamed protein product [Toxocara canis]
MRPFFGDLRQLSTLRRCIVPALHLRAMDIEADFLSHRNDTTMLLENVIGSSIVALLITAFLPPYVLILRIVYGDIEFSTSSYRIIFHLGVADCTQLIFQIPAIVFNFLTETDAVRTISKVFGAFLHAGWVAYTALTLLLALNRFFVISDMKQTAFLCRRTPLTDALNWHSLYDNVAFVHLNICATGDMLGVGILQFYYLSDASSKTYVFEPGLGLDLWRQKSVLQGFQVGSGHIEAS